MSSDPAAGKEDGGKGQDNRGNRKGGFFSEIKAADFIELFLTAVLATVAVVQACFILRANRIAGEAVTAAKDSSTAAKDSSIAAQKAVELAQDTAQKQLRAYVLPTKAEVLGLKTKGPLWARITVRNSGQTPASNVTIEAYSWWEKYPVTEPEAGAMPTAEGAQVTLAAGEQIFIDHGIKDPHRQELTARTLTLQVAGTVRYTDIFGTKHESRFCFLQGGDYAPASPQMSLAKNGNTAD